MNEIERVREELDKDIEHSITEDEEQNNRDILTYFNLGVSLAHKEFLDKIDEIENKRKLFEYGFKRETQIKDFIIELKKSLRGSA